MKKLIALVLCIVMVVASSFTLAEDASWPKQTITIVVPFGAGGSTDLLARVLADEMAKILNVNVIVNNITGASGTTGTGEVAAATPDGYTLIFNASGPICTQPHLLDNLTYSISDFRGIAGVASDSSSIAVPASSKIQTIEELIACKDAMLGGHTGNGTVHQIALSALVDTAELNVTAIPYQGGANLVTAVMGEQVDVAADVPSEYFSGIEAGAIRLLATTGAERSPYFPDVPTLKEVGIDCVVSLEYFMLAPAGVSDEVANILEDAVLEAAKADTVQDFLVNTGYTYNPTTGAEIYEKLSSDLEYFGTMMG